MKTIKNLTFAAWVATLLIQTPIARADDQGPLRITFEKCAVSDGTLAGTVTGDCGDGTVVFTYLEVVPGKAIWRFSGEYAISTTSGCSFKAVCSGIVDVGTGHIVLNGVVTEGEQLGARVQVQAQANADLTCSAGTMIITPGESE